MTSDDFRRITVSLAVGSRDLQYPPQRAGVPSSGVRRLEDRWQTGPATWLTVFAANGRRPFPELLRFLQEDPTRLQSLTPDQFEQFVANRLDRMGYIVTLTGASNRKDGGIDLIAVPKVSNLGSLVIAGQVKHHQCDQKTGREAVDRLLAWKDSYFGVGLLATNTAFTKDAIWKAQQDRNARFLRLRDFTDLKRWLHRSMGNRRGLPLC